MTALAASAQDELLAVLLLDLAIVAACALALGALARRIGQAIVVGEIAAGLMLGPSLLGLLPGDIDGLLFPEDVRPYLQVLASVALTLFMFGVGYEIDLGRVRRSSRAAARVASASVLLPTLAAIAITPALWAAHPPPVKGVSAIELGAFLAIAFSVTAFPVLARILTDTGLSKTRLGSLALVIAAMTDLVAWIALAGLTAVLGAGHALPIGVLLAALVAFFVVLMFGVRPLLRAGLAARWCARHGNGGASLLLLVALALSAAGTTALGLHPAFGAFALGVACPRPSSADAAVGRAAALRVPGEGAAVGAHTLSAAGLVLVPLYFIVTGLNDAVTSLGLAGALEVCGLLVVVSGAKIVGVAFAAARSGMERGPSVVLGLLMNTRGLTELVVLDVGGQESVIDNRLFTVLVLVAVLTTAMTTPLLPRAMRIGAGARQPLPVRGYAGG